VLADQERAEAQLGRERDLLDVLADGRGGAGAGRVLGADEQAEAEVVGGGPRGGARVAGGPGCRMRVVRHGGQL